jgi:GDP-4-dehydro-6-deoxy-D-mannose reductase
VSVQEIADGLLDRATRPIKLVTDPDLVRPVDVPRMIGSNEKLRAATGWAPEISLDRTVADVLDHARTSLSS